MARRGERGEKKREREEKMDCSFQTEIRNWKGEDPSLHESNKIDEGTKLWWTNRMEVSGWKVKPLTTHPETRFKTLLAAPRRCAIGAIDTYMVAH